MFKLKNMKNNDYKGLNYSLYESSYAQEVPTEQLYIVHYNVLPSKYSNSNVYKKKPILDYIQWLGFKMKTVIIHQERRIDNGSVHYQRLYENVEKKMFIRTYNEYDTKETVNIEMIYDGENNFIQDLINFNDLKKYEVEKKKSNISLIKVEMGGHLDTEDFFLNVPDIDLQLNYGESFVKIHNLIEERLNKDYDKGIILLHGDPGTGKCVVGETKIILRNKKTGEVFEKNIKDLI